MTDFLVSGTRSGFGRHAREVFDAVAWDRETPDSEQRRIRETGVGVVVHSAFNSSPVVHSANAAQYARDNLFLTAELLEVPCRLFVLMSTVDVYPAGGGPHSEEETVELGRGQGPYAVTKLMSEALVRERSGRHLILRCSSLLGPAMRKNTLTRLLDGQRRVGLSPGSRFNYVLHEDVSAFIRQAYRTGLSGTFNTASTGNASLAEVAALIGPDVEFGDHPYDCGVIDNSKIAALAPAFRRSSLETVSTFIQAQRGGR